MSTSGRPKFQIDPHRLRGAREQAGLTQSALAERAYTQLGKTHTDERARETSYQRIERTGKTSAKFAAVLAANVGVTVEHLQGATPDSPPDRLALLAAQLRTQMEAGNEAVKLALVDHTDESNPFRALAVQIATELEVAQLEGRAESFDQLAQLTGLSVEELLRPGSLHGHWMLVVNRCGMRNTKIVVGVHEALHSVQEEATDWLAGQWESDVHVQLEKPSKESPWFRVTFKHPRIPQKSWSISFVRSAVSKSGLRWVKPTQMDCFWIDQMRRWASGCANFVSGFDSAHRHSMALRNLRMLITKPSITAPLTQINNSQCEGPETLAIHKGNLDELPDSVFEAFKAEGGSHDLVTTWLSSGLWELLELHLIELPLSWWRIEPGAGGIRVILDVDIPDAVRRGLPLRGGVRYIISLVEEISESEFRFVPWRASSALKVVDRLRGELQRRQRDKAVEHSELNSGAQAGI